MSEKQFYAEIHLMLIEVRNGGDFRGLVSTDILVLVFPATYRSLAWKHLMRWRAYDIHCHQCGISLTSETTGTCCAAEECVWIMPASESDDTNRSAMHAVHVAVSNSARGKLRRAREKEADGYHRAEDVASILEEQNRRCYYCGTPLSGRQVVKDHIEPLSRGGSQWPDNIALACAPCNNLKNCEDESAFWRKLKPTLSCDWVEERPKFVRRQKTFKKKLRAALINNRKQTKNSS